MFSYYQSILLFLNLHVIYTLSKQILLVECVFNMEQTKRIVILQNAKGTKKTKNVYRTISFSYFHVREILTGVCFEQM